MLLHTHTLSSILFKSKMIVKSFEKFSLTLSPKDLVYQICFILFWRPIKNVLKAAMIQDSFWLKRFSIFKKAVSSFGKQPRTKNDCLCYVRHILDDICGENILTKALLNFIISVSRGLEIDVDKVYSTKLLYQLFDSQFPENEICQKKS